MKMKLTMSEHVKNMDEELTWNPTCSYLDSVLTNSHYQIMPRENLNRLLNGS